MQKVFVQTNDAAGNSVVVFEADDDGRLARGGSFATGGAGDGKPHLTSQGSVVLTGNARHLLVTNAGSGELSVFAVRDALELVATVRTGAAPKSVTEHDGVVYVLNTGDPSLVGFELRGDALREIPDSRRALPDGADPAQVGFTPDGSAVVVTERGTNAIALYAVDADGYLGARSVLPSAGPTPYGFAFAGNTLVVTEAFGAAKGKAAASSYSVRGTGATVVTPSVGNGRSEICWAVVTKDGRYAFATNFADGAVSRYAIGDDGRIALEDAAAATTVDGRAGLRDEDLSNDGRFLYAVDADARRVFGWHVGDAGALSPLGSWDGLPATAAGIAAL